MNSLWQHFQKFSWDYQKQAVLLTGKEVADEIANNNEMINFQEFEVTAYTSQECGTITSVGIDLKANYAKYLNVCAVDPKIIPYGSTVLIKFYDGTIKAYVAVDCGGLIKGKKLDLYFTDVKEAIDFGRQKLQVQIIK
jgi:3D (Asp-Asp-Asp) domain-containing protein